MIFSPEFGLLALNLLLGFGCALPLAGYLRGLFLKPVGNFRLWAALIGIYFSEGVAVGIGMGIPVFSAGLAFVWGAVFARKLRGKLADEHISGASFYLSLYSCLPAISMFLIPGLCLAGGRDVLSSAEGRSFGIPGFLHLPWPLDTIMGFYTALIAGTVAFKLAVTPGVVRLLLKPRDRKAEQDPPSEPSTH